jgi:hypothetical protein
MVILFPSNISSHENIVPQFMKLYCMEFQTSGNPVYIKWPNHRASFSSQQLWAIKEIHLIDNLFTQRRCSNLAASLNQNRLKPTAS